MADREDRWERRQQSYPEAGARRRLPIWPELEPAMQELPPAVVQRRTRVRRRRGGRRWWLIPAIVAGLVLIAFIVLSWIESRSQGRILSNVYIAGVEVGDLTPEDAQARLRLHYEDFQAQPLVLVYADWVWRPSGDEIGVRVDWSEAISEAMALGRGGSFLDRWQQRWQSWNSRYDLLLPLRFDEGKLQTYLQGLARKIDVLPQDAALVVAGQEVAIRPSRAGRTLEMVPTVREVEDALLRLSSAPVTLTVHVTPPAIDDHAAEGALDTARRMLAGPVTLRYGDRAWTLTTDQIGEMLKIERRQEGTEDRLAVVLDQERLREFVEGVAAEVRVLPRNAHFRFVEDHLEMVDEGAPGQELKVDVAMSQVNQAVVALDRDVQLNVQEVLPEINRDTVGQLGIREVVGVGETTFVGSAAYRIHNIIIAARILDGTLIGPGETFSFIQSIGSIDESDGFVPGYSIVGGRTVLNVGGGVCQVSTTVFRAAFFAGLPITERHAHDFRIGWYEQDSLGIVGLDATVYVDTGTDLKFVNNTSGWLLMQFEVYTDSAELYVYLYGTMPNYEVTLDGPYLSNWTPAPTAPVCVENPDLPVGYSHQTDWARDGVDVVVYRKILVNGEEISSEPFYSHFKAWPNVYEAHSCSP
jgi:vancomycin resistance protein YoaR